MLKKVTLTFKLPLLVLVVFGLCSCGTSPELKTYVIADRLTFAVVSVDYLKWLATSKLPKDKKDRRTRLIDSWRQRITSAEKSVEGK